MSISIYWPYIPATMNPEERISDVGLGLLYHLCEAARRLNAAVLWGETTSASASYYQKFFALPELTGQLVISSDKRDAFCRAILQKWAWVATP